MIKEELLYTREHEWVKLEGNRATVGVTDFAQHSLGDIVYVDLPAVGTKIEAGATLATVESVKAVSEVFAPLSGAVVKINEDLPQSPESVNQDPYGQGWIAVLEITQPEQVKNLLSAKDYEPLTKEV